MSSKETREQKRRQKRREKYNEAVKRKMDSAADLADRYAKTYEQIGSRKSLFDSGNKSELKRKTATIVFDVVMQSLSILIVISVLFFTIKTVFSDSFNDFFGREKREFSSVLVLEDAFIGSDNETKKLKYAEVAQPVRNSRYAVLKGNNISADIYYNITTEALLSGVCHDMSTSLPGYGKPILLCGYGLTTLKGISEVDIGDVLSITTNYGVYKYSVSAIETFDKNADTPYNVNSNIEQLIICTDNLFEKYQTETSQTFCVIADKVSGPEIVY